MVYIDVVNAGVVIFGHRPARLDRTGKLSRQETLAPIASPTQRHQHSTYLPISPHPRNQRQRNEPSNEQKCYLDKPNHSAHRISARYNEREPVSERAQAHKASGAATERILAIDKHSAALRGQEAQIEHLCFVAVDSKGIAGVEELHWGSLWLREDERECANAWGATRGC
jgi:hypothetical protein